LEGPRNEEVILLEFPSYEAALAWYHSLNTRPLPNTVIKQAIIGSS